jgi:hypothetical protein
MRDLEGVADPPEDLEYDVVVFEVLMVDRCSEARFLAINMWGGLYGSLIFGTWVYSSFSNQLKSARLQFSLALAGRVSTRLPNPSSESPVHRT